MKRVVVAVDPSGTRGAEDGGDSIGIVVAGKGLDDKFYVLADRTCKLGPDGWGRVAVAAYREFRADRIVAERNFGGAMVQHVIRTVDPCVSYRDVTASRGKIARAEPVAALYEQGKVRHACSMPELEDQMAAMTSDGFTGDGSPDRVDALVWALSELALTVRAPPPVFGHYWGGHIHIYSENEMFHRKMDELNSQLGNPYDKGKR
jgi:predicted phage terminase large subunit-like protein